MNFSSANLSDLESLITTLFANNKCACHIINPNKTRILMWKEVKNGQTIYHLRLGIQKFGSQEQIDRNGEIYWRFRDYDYPEVKAENKEEELPAPSQLDPITKFQSRPQKTESINHDELNHEPAVNNCSK